MRKFVFWWMCLSLGQVLILSGCKEDEESYSVPESQLAFCDEHCQIRADLDCFDGIAIADYKAYCEENCIARYEKHPNCEAELITLDNCAKTDVSYACGQDNFEIIPADACGEENYYCSECTGDDMGCAM
jgi:hypothetical protein